MLTDSMQQGETVNIRQAARWAERKGALYRVMPNGQTEYLYAVYDTRNLLVECIGLYAKCKAYCAGLGSEYDSMPTKDGRYLRTEALDTVVQEMDEAEGEAGCIPEPSYMREWS